MILTTLFLKFRLVRQGLFHCMTAGKTVFQCSGVEGFVDTVCKTNDGSEMHLIPRSQAWAVRWKGRLWHR